MLWMASVVVLCSCFELAPSEAVDCSMAMAAVFYLNRYTTETIQS